MIERTLTLSTAHISSKTNDILQELKPSDFLQDAFDDDKNKLPFRFIANHHYGYIIFLSDYNKEDESIKRVLLKVPDLNPMIAFAVSKDCTMINLDRDAEVIPDLPTFEW